MTTKKLLIVANNCDWRSWSDKLDELRAWFSSKVVLEITKVDTHYADIPFIQYENPTADQIGYKRRLGVDYDWYDTHISSMATGYDIVLFVVNANQWPKDNDMRGWRVDRTNGAIELQIGAGEREQFKWGDYIGGVFFNYARHEICHALFMITGQKDTTHYWWDKSPVELTNARDELVFVDPRESEEISKLEKIIAFLKKLIGLQTQLNQLKMQDSAKVKASRENLCIAIKEYEGYVAPGVDSKFPNGTLAWRNKNPGNLRYAGQIGSIGQNQGFAVFPDFETGFAALKRQIDAACEGRSKVFRPAMSIREFFQVYAPSTDNNNPTAYAQFVAGMLDVSTAYEIQDLV